MATQFVLDKYEVQYVSTPFEMESPSFQPGGKSLVVTNKEWNASEADVASVELKEVQVAERFFPMTKTLQENTLSKLKSVAGDKMEVVHYALAPLNFSNQAVDVGFSGFDLGRLVWDAKAVVLSQEWQGKSDPSLVTQSRQTLEQIFFAHQTKLIFATTHRVVDVSNAVITKRIYRGLKQGLSPQASLREAQIFVKKTYKHPAYWSGYQLKTLGI